MASSQQRGHNLFRNRNTCVCVCVYRREEDDGEEEEEYEEEAFSTPCWPGALSLWILLARIAFLRDFLTPQRIFVLFPYCVYPLFVMTRAIQDDISNLRKIDYNDDDEDLISAFWSLKC